MNVGRYLWLAFFGVAYLTSRSELFGVDVVTSMLGLMLLALCLWPAVAWLISGMRHLPLFEVYSFVHLIYYWIPAGNSGSEVLDLTVEDRATALGAVCLFLAFGQLAYFGLLRRLRARQSNGMSFWSNRVAIMQNGLLPWFLLLVALGYNIGMQSGVIWNFMPWSALPYVRALSGVSGLLGVFVLGRLAGEGRLSGSQIVLFVVGVMTITSVSYASGYLGVGTVFVGNAFFAYSIGARRVPVIALATFLCILSFLNYGKAEVRMRYWSMGEAADDVVELYSFWVRSSWEQFNTPENLRHGVAISALDRANLTHVFTRITVQTPHPVPYLNGQTYIDSLQLFVPRAFWPDRPDLNAFMNELGLRYGIHQNMESTQETNISLGQIGEAWANGGWLAVGVVGAFFGCLFHLGVRTAYGRDTDTVGFLFGMTLVAFTVNLEQLVGTILMGFYQTAVTCLALLFLLSRRVRPTTVASTAYGFAEVSESRTEESSRLAK